MFLGTFSKNFDQKLRFFRARSTLKISIYWRQSLLKNFKVRPPKIDIPPPLNPHLIYRSFSKSSQKNAFQHNLEIVKLFAMK